MNKYTKILKIVIFVLGGIIILGILISGCDKLKCHPTINIKDKGIGFSCGGEW